MKKETLEEAAVTWAFETNGHKWSNNNDEAADNYNSFKVGAIWEREHSELKYSLEDVRNAVYQAVVHVGTWDSSNIVPKIENWFEDFKNEETLEDSLADYIDRHIVESLVEVAKQKLYTEEEVLKLLRKRDKHTMNHGLIGKWLNPKDWFEHFKKK